jgi:hypothetical protein
LFNVQRQAGQAIGVPRWPRCSPPTGPYRRTWRVSPGVRCRGPRDAGRCGDRVPGQRRGRGGNNGGPGRLDVSRGRAVRRRPRTHRLAR